MLCLPVGQQPWGRRFLRATLTVSEWGRWKKKIVFQVLTQLPFPCKKWRLAHDMSYRTKPISSLPPCVKTVTWLLPRGCSLKLKYSGSSIFFFSFYFIYLFFFLRLGLVIWKNVLSTYPYSWGEMSCSWRVLKMIMQWNNPNRGSQSKRE